MDKEQRIEEILKDTHVTVIQPDKEGKPIYIECHIVASSAYELARQIYDALFPQGDDEGLIDLQQFAIGYIDYPKDDDGEFDMTKPKFTKGHIQKVWREIAKAQRDLTRQERLDRPDREKMAEIFKVLKRGDVYKAIHYGEEERTFYQSGLAHQIYKAFIPNEEEIGKQLDTLKTEIADLNKKLDDREVDLLEAKREERKRIIRVLGKGQVKGWEDEEGNPTVAIFLKPKVWQSLKSANG